MKFNSNREQYKSSNWNPFAPTKRDIERTAYLASKSPIIASILGFLFPIAAIFYVNRIENFLKIMAYMIILSFSLVIILSIYIIFNKDKGYEEVSQIFDKCKIILEFITELCPIAATEENTIAIILARKRKSEVN